MASSDYAIELTPTAEKVYRRLFEESSACLAQGDTGNSKVTTFHMVEEALDRIIPHDPFATERALSGPLSGLVRVKKGRIRICYAASSKLKKIVIIYIYDTPRKAGDIQDPYSILTRLVLSGKMDTVFQELGIRRPPKHT